MNEWTTVEDWLGILESERGADEAAIARSIVDWSAARKLKHRGEGSRQHSQGIVYTPVIPAVDWDPAPFAVSSRSLGAWCSPARTSVLRAGGPMVTARPSVDCSNA